jgi:hypothetical protein
MLLFCREADCQIQMGEAVRASSSTHVVRGVDPPADRYAMWCGRRTIQRTPTQFGYLAGVTDPCHICVDQLRKAMPKTDTLRVAVDALQEHGLAVDLDVLQLLLATPPAAAPASRRTAAESQPDGQPAAESAHGRVSGVWQLRRMVAERRYTPDQAVDEILAILDYLRTTDTGGLGLLELAMFDGEEWVNLVRTLIPDAPAAFHDEVVRSLAGGSWRLEEADTPRVATDETLVVAAISEDEALFGPALPQVVELRANTGLSATEVATVIRAGVQHARSLGHVLPALMLYDTSVPAFLFRLLPAATPSFREAVNNRLLESTLDMQAEFERWERRTALAVQTGSPPSSFTTFTLEDLHARILATLEGANGLAMDSPVDRRTLADLLSVELHDAYRLWRAAPLPTLPTVVLQALTAAEVLAAAAQREVEGFGGMESGWDDEGRALAAALRAFEDVPYGDLALRSERR